MFEHAQLIEIGDLEQADDGVRGMRLKLRDDRVITVRGLTKDECRIISKFFCKVLILDLRVA